MPLLEDPSATTLDHFNPPVHHDALEDPAFAAESERRSIARLVSAKGDSNERLRQALLRRHRILRMPLANSKSCDHWRESGALRIKKTQVARTSHGKRTPAHVKASDVLARAPRSIPVIQDDCKTLQHKGENRSGANPRTFDNAVRGLATRLRTPSRCRHR